MTPLVLKTSLIKAYYELCKPGIVYGNALTAFAAYIFASHQAIDWSKCALMLIGLSCIVASACALNNVIDRDIDAIMERTKSRPLPRGAITPKAAAIFGIMLFSVGSALLSTTTLAALIVAFVGFVTYLAFYTPVKRVSPHALFLGAIAGATPPVVGYAAVGGAIDATAWWLFAFLLVWQIPHFLAIAVYRYNEYVAAHIPLYVSHEPTPRLRRFARATFYCSLIVLLAWCLILILHR